MELHSRIDFILFTIFSIIAMASVALLWLTMVRKPKEQEIHKWEKRDFSILAARYIQSNPLYDKPSLVYIGFAIVALLFGFKLAVFGIVANLVVGWTGGFIMRNQKLHFPEKEAEMTEFIIRTAEKKKQAK